MVNVILYGPGSVGLEFIELAKKQGISILAIADSSSLITKVEGFSHEDLEHIKALKHSGRKLNDAVSDEITAVNSIVDLDYDIGTLLVDATIDPEMIHVLNQALELGIETISVNKSPFARTCKYFNPPKDTFNLLALENNLFESIFAGKAYLRGTVGADMGVPGTLEEALGTPNPNTVYIQGCMSGTLCYTMSKIDNGKKLSDAVREAVKMGYTETRPYTDYSGKDVLNKAVILWRMVATSKGIDLNDVEINYKSFLQPVIDRYNRDNSDKFDANSLANLEGKAFVDKVSVLDDTFETLKSELPSDQVFRYIAKIEYGSKGVRKINVGLKAVQKDSEFGKLSGPDNLFVIKTEKNQYQIGPGRGAGPRATANAIMNDLKLMTKYYP